MKPGEEQNLFEPLNFFEQKKKLIIREVPVIIFIEFFFQIARSESNTCVSYLCLLISFLGII